MMIREIVDAHRGRNVARLIFDDANSEVYLETVGNHDGVPVVTSVRMTRVSFACLVRELGVM